MRLLGVGVRSEGCVSRRRQTICKGRQYTAGRRGGRKRGKAEADTPYGKLVCVVLCCVSLYVPLMYLCCVDSS